MNALILAIVLMFAAIGAILGWRKGTINIEQPPGKYDFPGGMTRREHLRMLTRRQRRLRIPLTVVYALAGGALGFGILMVYAVFIRR